MITIALGILTGLVFLISIRGIEIPLQAYFQILLFPIFLNLAMWFIFGYEKIIIMDDQLEIIKSNRIFSRSQKYNLCEIKSVEIRKKKSRSIERIQYIKEMRNAMLIWRNMGQIILKTDNSESTILNGLHENEIVKMKLLLEKEIEQQCS
jgi:energy-coupling factor transporter transmembrane protein EcfT